MVDPEFVPMLVFSRWPTVVHVIVSSVIFWLQDGNSFVDTLTQAASSIKVVFTNPAYHKNVSLYLFSLCLGTHPDVEMHSKNIKVTIGARSLRGVS